MLTDAVVRRLKPRDVRYEVKDTGDYGRGTLLLRIYPTGRKVFSIVFWQDGRNRRITLGEYGEQVPQISLAEARQKAAEIALSLERGIVPVPSAASPMLSAEEPVMPYTVAQLAEDYVRIWAMPRKRSWKDDEEDLRLDVLPLWGQKSASEITRRDVIQLLDGIVARGAPIAANRRLALIRKVFNFGISRGELAMNPCSGLTSVTPEREKERALSEEELRIFLEYLLNSGKGMTGTVRLALLTLLGTAQRPGEVCQMRRGQVAGNWWTIPGSIAKNGIAHRVPLSPWVQKMLARCPEDGPCYFPSRNRPDVPMGVGALGHALRNNMSQMGLEPFTPHDIRRTAATQIARMGHGRFVVKKILNHVESGVTGIYDRYDYDREKQLALAALGSLLETLVSVARS